MSVRPLRHATIDDLLRQRRATNLLLAATLKEKYGVETEDTQALLGRHGDVGAEADAPNGRSGDGDGESTRQSDAQGDENWIVVDVGRSDPSLPASRESKG